MKAPDKKYPLSIVGDLLASMPANEVVFMPNKIYFDGVDTSTTPRLAINEEYIRKDALIEWASKKFGQVSDMGFDDGDVEHGYTRALEDVIDKLNSM